MKRIGIILEPSVHGRPDWGEAWLFDVIEAHPAISFTISLIDGHAAQEGEMSWPANLSVVELGGDEGPAGKRRRRPRLDSLVRAFTALAAAKRPDDKTISDALIEGLHIAPEMAFHDFWRDPVAWELLVVAAERRNLSVPFGEFRDVVRDLARPLWECFRRSRCIPEADLYHGIGGERAALLTSTLARSRGTRFFVTESGDRVQALWREQYRECVHEPGTLTMEATHGLDLKRRARLRLFRMAMRTGRLSHSVGEETDDGEGSEPGGETRTDELLLRTRTIRGASRIEDLRRVRMRRVAVSPTDTVIGFAMEKECDETVLDWFLQAAGHVGRQFESVRFDVFAEWEASSESKRDALQERWAPNLPIRWKSLDGIEDSLARIDILILPDQRASGDQILVHCFEAQIPVIASWINRESDLLLRIPPDEKNRYFLPVGAGDAGELEDAMIDLLCDHRRREEAGRLAHRHLRRVVDHDRMIDDWRILYQGDVRGRTHAVEALNEQAVDLVAT